MRPRAHCDIFFLRWRNVYEIDFYEITTSPFSLLQLREADGRQRQETQRMLRPRALRDDCRE